MKVLVLGAAGQLGANLVRALLDKGEQVRAFVRPTSKLVTLQGLDVERVHGDFNDAASLERACQGVRVVYHAGAYYPAQTIAADRATAEALTQTRNVLEAARHASVERLVFASTLTTIGFPSDPTRPADETCPFATQYRDNPYLMSKAAMEDAVLAAAKAGLPAVVVNPTAFFGPYDSKPTSGTQIIMIAKRLMPAYVQGPVNVIDVRDVAMGMIRAAERGKAGERYILGNWNTTQKELNGLIAKVAGVPAPLFPAPFTLARYGSKVGDWAFRTILRRLAPVPGFFVEMLKHMQHYDCSKAIRELELPQSSVEQTIRDAIAWFKQNGYLSA
jgi:dihydroflavonol-4-reductase